MDRGRLIIAIDWAPRDDVQVCSEYRGGQLKRQWIVEEGKEDEGNEETESGGGCGGGAGA